MIIVCDLDRTLLPNGKDEYDGTLDEFYSRISALDEVVLVYATGRNLELFEEAEKEYGIKKPDFLLGSVGTEVFINNQNQMEHDYDWGAYIKEKHPNWNRDKIVSEISETLSGFGEKFYLQEDFFQNENKISYYLKDLKSENEILNKIENYLKDKEIDAELIYSFDPHKVLGLIDILPKSATKLGAVEFLVNKLGKSLDDVIYCGDSGNDLLPLTSGIKGVLVKNAPEKVKQQALEIVKEKGFSDKLYIANGDQEMNGNYSSGVIEGLKHFNVF